MNVSSVTMNDSLSRKNLFIRYANSFTASINNNEDVEGEISPMPPTKPDKKVDKNMGIETLTIFPKQIVEGKTVIIA